MAAKIVWWSALPLIVGMPAAASAQSTPLAAAPPVMPPAASSAPEQIVEFAADQVVYDNNAELVTASGAVRMNREGNFLAADQVIWDRKTGKVFAKGSVVLLTPEGNKLVGDSVELTDTLKDGTINDLAIALESGGRLAAARGTRSGSITTLENAIYSPCPVQTSSGCPKRPSWSITAARVIDDQAHQRLRFIGGRLQLFGLNLPLLPVFNIGQGKNGTTGWLMPDFSVSTHKGFEIAVPYHWQIAPNRDLTLTPHVYTGVLPAIEAKYRALNSVGAYQVGAFLTYGRIESLDPAVTTERKGVRAYVEGNGKWQLDPLWSVTASARAATDKTLTRRYDITNDDRLRSVINVERITPNSYISIAGWAFEGLRLNDRQREIPIALPAIDARFRKEHVAGGTLELQANSLSVLRLDGQDTQRAFASAEWDLRRITPNSYISIAGWAFEGLRLDDRQREIPIALPAIDARFRKEHVAGGTLELQANSLSVLRLDGQDTQRAFASAEWDLRRITPWGQLVTLTALARGDIYHTDNAESTLVPIYRGENGWHARGIGALAADVQWPFVGQVFGGFQRIVPHVQLVLTPPTQNLSIPNEDSRSIDLQDSNLFALNRFPGYDRWEDASRITYGFDYSLQRRNVVVDTTIGQSFRINDRKGIFPEGTGLTDRLSDIVGRTSIRYGRLLDLTHRFRVDRNNFAVRRNELDLTFGTTQTYAQVGYLRLNRNIDSSIEDLRDVEELSLAGRILFKRYWSIFGATVVDLSDKSEDPTSVADGWEPVRHRLGIQYEDDCLQIGVTWRRDYQRVGAFRAGNRFAIHLALKGVSR